GADSGSAGDDSDNRFSTRGEGASGFGSPTGPTPRKRSGGQGREVTERERADQKSRASRSQPVRLPAPVVEEGSSADYDADGALVITLRRELPARTRASG